MRRTNSPRLGAGTVRQVLNASRGGSRLRGRRRPASPGMIVAKRAFRRSAMHGLKIVPLDGSTAEPIALRLNLTASSRIALNMLATGFQPVISSQTISRLDTPSPRVGIVRADAASSWPARRA